MSSYSKIIGNHLKRHKNIISAGLESGRKKPNIVFILADDLGHNDVPWHNPGILAPHLNHLASTGVILESNYVQAGITRFS